MLIKSSPTMPPSRCSCSWLCSSTSEVLPKYIGITGYAEKTYHQSCTKGTHKTPQVTLSLSEDLSSKPGGWDRRRQEAPPRFENGSKSSPRLESHRWQTGKTWAWCQNHVEPHQAPNGLDLHRLLTHWPINLRHAEKSDTRFYCPMSQVSQQVLLHISYCQSAYGFMPVSTVHSYRNSFGLCVLPTQNWCSDPDICHTSLNVSCRSVLTWTATVWAVPWRTNTFLLRFNLARPLWTGTPPQLNRPRSFVHRDGNHLFLKLIDQSFYRSIWSLCNNLPYQLQYPFSSSCGQPIDNWIWWPLFRYTRLSTPTMHPITTSRKLRPWLWLPSLNAGLYSSTLRTSVSRLTPLKDTTYSINRIAASLTSSLVTSYIGKRINIATPILPDILKLLMLMPPRLASSCVFKAFPVDTRSSRTTPWCVTSSSWVTSC